MIPCAQQQVASLTTDFRARHTVFNSCQVLLMKNMSFCMSHWYLVDHNNRRDDVEVWRGRKDVE